MLPLFLVSLLPSLCTALSAIGIDVGSSAIKMASIQHGTSSFELIYDKGSERIFKPIFAFYKDEYFFSHEAEKVLTKCPDCVLLSFTQELVDGHHGNKSDKFKERDYILGGKKFTLQQIASLFFAYLKQVASVQLNEAVDSCVLAVPDDAADTNKVELYYAALAAGWKNVSQYSNIFAGSLYYTLQNRAIEKNTTVRLIDFGHRLTSAVLFTVIPKNGTKPLTLKYISNELTSKGINGHKYDIGILEAIINTTSSSIKEKILRSKKALGALHKKLANIKKTLGFNSHISVTSDIYDSEDQEFNVNIDSDKISSNLKEHIDETSEFLKTVISENSDTIVAIGAHQRSTPIQTIIRNLKISFINSVNPEDCVAFGSAFLAARDHPSFRTYVVSAHDFLTAPVCIDINGLNGETYSTCAKNITEDGKVYVDFQVKSRQFEIALKEEENVVWHVNVDVPVECTQFRLWLYKGKIEVVLPLSVECMELEKRQEIPLKDKEIFDVRVECEKALEDIQKAVVNYLNTEERNNLLSAIQNTIESIDIELSLLSGTDIFQNLVKSQKTKFEARKSDVNALRDIAKDVLLIKEDIMRSRERYSSIDSRLNNLTDQVLVSSIRDNIKDTNWLDSVSYEKILSMIDNPLPDPKTESIEANEKHIEL